MILWILAGTIAISLIAFVGLLTISLKEKLLKKLMLFLVSLSAGTLMGGAFLHLIPEAVELGSNAYFYVLSGFILFFLIEKFLHWRHCHEGKCPVHTFAYMNMIGDGVHNFIDGLIIAASFVADFNIGIATTIAIAMHEIPQEMGDFGVLVYGGYSKTRALFLNFVTALTAVAGGIIGYVLSGSGYNLTPLLLPFAAGGFIYIAASDLIPEIRKEHRIRKFLPIFAVFILGIVLMAVIK